MPLRPEKSPFLKMFEIDKAKLFSYTFAFSHMACALEAYKTNFGAAQFQIGIFPEVKSQNGRRWELDAN